MKKKSAEKNTSKQQIFPWNKITGFFFLLIFTLPFLLTFYCISSSLETSLKIHLFAKPYDIEKIDINSYGSQPNRAKSLSITDSSTTGFVTALKWKEAPAFLTGGESLKSCTLMKSQLATMDLGSASSPLCHCCLLGRGLVMFSGGVFIHHHKMIVFSSFHRT